MKPNIYKVKKTSNDINLFSNEKFWENINPLEIKHYLWIKKKYTPKVFAKLCYSGKYLFLFFKVFEEKITARYLQLGDPVYKDSCVEFFFNPFPQHSKDYFNFEMNALGTMLVGVGESRGPGRKVLVHKNLAGLEIIPSVQGPICGQYGGDFWTLHLLIPLELFENYYKLPFTGGPASANFYKCGDETEFEHYGTWNPIESSIPDFHLPQYFGRIIFEQ